jgi:hypothetical protein
LPKIKNLILVPAVISLGVTVLRLVGELNHGSPALFNASAGGGGALVGIFWLIPIFGVYFSVKLIKSGHGTTSAGKAIGLAILSIVLVMGLFVVTTLVTKNQNVQLLVSAVASFVGIWVLLKGWPELSKTLVAYAFAARIPVAILMFFAIMGNWGTHYDVPPSPDFPEMGWVAKWFWIGLIPQLTVWIWTTAALGSIFGAIAAFFVKPKSAEAILP